VLSKRHIDRVVELVAQLEKLGDLQELIAILGAARP